MFEDWLKMRSEAELAAAEGHDSKGRGRQKHGRSKLPQKLAIEYKCDIANSQLEQKQKEMVSLCARPWYHHPSCSIRCVPLPAVTEAVKSRTEAPAPPSLS